MSRDAPELPGGGTRVQPAAALALCSPQNTACRALTCSFGPGAALAWSSGPGASSLGLPEDLEGCPLALRALAAAAQARGQMHLRGLGKVLHLQE